MQLALDFTARYEPREYQHVTTSDVRLWVREHRAGKRALTIALYHGRPESTVRWHLHRKGCVLTRGRPPCR